jgi:hypothetical protein
MTLDPLRLLDGDELTPDERRALGADHTEPSPAGAKRAIWAALSLQLAAPATAAAATLATAAPTAASGASAVATASTITAVALVKSATIGVALGAAVGTGLYFGGRSETPRPAPSVVQRAEQGKLGATSVAAPFHAAPPRVVAPPSAAASDSAPPAAETTPPVARPAPRIDVPSAERAPAPPPVEDESRRVAAARAALRSGNASTALAQLDALALDEPHGLLVQEREALVVEALAALGRLDAARARADAFLTRYPRSPHTAAVRRAAGYAP